MWKKQLDRDIALSDYTTMMNNMKIAKEAEKIQTNMKEEFDAMVKEDAIRFIIDSYMR